jgi:hypothetical protein
VRVLRSLLLRDRAAWSAGDSAPFAEFVAPAPLLAVVVMVVNDRVLKPDHPGVLAGKLTDFAFCFFGPLYVAALLSLLPGVSPRRRAIAGVLASLVYFVPLKLSQGLCDAYVLVLDAIGRGLHLEHHQSFADPTDLVALCMLPLAYGYARARSRRALSSSSLLQEPSP